MDTKDVKEYIKQSLFLLMETTPYEKISMDMISAKSGVSRRTIYRYFDNKTDILNYYMKEMVNEYYRTVQSKIENTANLIARSFQFVSDNVKFFQIAYKNNLLSSIIEVLEDVIRKMVSNTKNKKYKGFNTDNIDYYIAFVSGGCYRMLCQYLKEENQHTPKQMASIYRRIISDLDKRWTGNEK